MSDILSASNWSAAWSWCEEVTSSDSLDEIDAALDDANIGRFCETLHEFTENSQFLIITHNKRTISNADTVFGVTMPEKGVSTLVSMRFNKENNAAQTAGVE